MGQILHGSAKTTHAIRGELQRSQASVASRAKRYGINEKTVVKWRHRRSVKDMPMGPKERRSTVLSPMEEAAIVALRVQARLPLDDVFTALKDVIPQLTRSSLHPCLQRHGISRLPKADREKLKKFKGYKINGFQCCAAVWSSCPTPLPGTGACTSALSLAGVSDASCLLADA